MPELPEVERARKLIQDSCVGYKIVKVNSTEDKIVYTTGTNHEEFAREIEGRTIKSCQRKGKTFWLELDGDGRQPVMHFGMTGMLQLKGQEPTWYRRRPRERSNVWPPRFYKFVLELEPQVGSIGQEPVEIAFLDGRRLGRLRLVPDPVPSHPPVSLLGFDPILNHPSLEEFQDLIKKKKGTTKGMIMDQAFSAGVGNIALRVLLPRSRGRDQPNLQWVADEVLYQARIHPACPVPALSPENISNLHDQLQRVCQTAVNVNADHRQFPEDWLFRWRWSKGKKQENGKKKHKQVDSGEDEEEDVKPKNKQFLALPNGRPATIDFIEVSGRTTAFVKELQKMPDGVEIKPKITKGGKGSRSKKAQSSDSVVEESSELSENESEQHKDVSQKPPVKRSARIMKSPQVKTEEETNGSGSNAPVVDAKRSTPRRLAAKSKVKGEIPEQAEAVIPAKRNTAKIAKESGRKRAARMPRPVSESSELSDE